jgi:hypothetical protein
LEKYHISRKNLKGRTNIICPEKRRKNIISPEKRRKNIISPEKI